MQWECNVSKVSAAVRVQYFPLTLYFPLLLLPYPLLRNGLLNISVMHLLLTFMSFMATGYCTRPCTLSSPSLCNIHWIQNIYTKLFLTDLCRKSWPGNIWYTAYLLRGMLRGEYQWYQFYFKYFLGLYSNIKVKIEIPPWTWISSEDRNRLDLGSIRSSSLSL